MTAEFEIAITAQHWQGPADGCSHGGIRAVIAGTVVTSEEHEYGVSQSALARCERSNGTTRLPNR